MRPLIPTQYRSGIVLARRSTSHLLLIQITSLRLPGIPAVRVNSVLTKGILNQAGIALSIVTSMRGTLSSARVVFVIYRGQRVIRGKCAHNLSPCAYTRACFNSFS